MFIKILNTYMLLHIKLPLLLLEVFHYGIKARTTGAVRDGYFVHVKLHGYDATTIEPTHLVGDVEDMVESLPL